MAPDFRKGFARNDLPRRQSYQVLDSAHLALLL
jgi:hypothetical protein